MIELIFWVLYFSEANLIFYFTFFKTETKLGYEIIGNKALAKPRNPVGFPS